MSLSVHESRPNFRMPSILPMSTTLPIFQAPVEDLFIGKWYMIRSSNGFWKDKRNVSINYTLSGSHIEDEAQYQTMNGDTTKVMRGRDTPIQDDTGIYNWQGKGLMRVASAKWEVLCFTPRPTDGDWMLVYAHRSIFTSPAINLMCKRKEGLNKDDYQEVDEWLRNIDDVGFQHAVDGMVDIMQS